MSDLWRLCVLAAVGVLAACSQTTDPPGVATSPTAAAFAEQDARAIPDASVNALRSELAAIPAAASTDYQISATDVLEVTVFQVPELSKSVRVSESGQITLPLIGAVPAAGKNATELEAEIAARLSAKYLQNPDVSVFVEDAVSQRVTVEGAVSKPGIYSATGRTTLLQMIALAGGLDRIADERGVVVFRYVNGKRQAAKFDYKAIRAGTTDDPILAGGDVVVVDQSGAKAALRNVRESIGLFGLFMPLI